MLIGRDGELATLRRLAGATRSGRSGVLILSGAAGNGKTLLLDALAAAERDRGMTVLRATGSELEADFDFGLVRQLLEVGCPAATVPVDGSVHERVHQWFLPFARLACAGPVLLAIDDVHLADEFSVRWLAHVALRLDGLPVAMVLTTTPGEPGRGPAYAALVEDPRHRRLELACLCREDHARLVSAAFDGLPDEAFLAACWQATSGNPLLARKLLEGLQTRQVRPTAAETTAVAEVSGGARRKIALGRLHRRPGRVRRVAESVAVLGDSVSTATRHLVAEHCGLTVTELRQAFAALVRDGVLVTGDRIEFAPPGMPDAILRLLPATERTTAHQRAAALLLDHGATPQLIAAQLLAVAPGMDPRAVRVLTDAARRAARHGDFAAAASFLRRARQEPLDAAQRAQLSHELGTAELCAGLPGAVTHLTEAKDLAVEPARRGMAASWLAKALQAEGARFESEDVLTGALRELTEVPEEAADAGRLREVRSRLRAQLVVQSCFWREQVAGAAALVVGTASPDTSALTTGERQQQLVFTAFEAGSGVLDADRAVDRVTTTLRGEPDATEQAPALYGAITLAMADRLDQATQLVDDMIGRGSAEPVPGLFGLERCVRADIHERAGELVEASDLAASALERFAGKSHPQEGFCVALLVESAIERGRLDEAEQILGSLTSPEARRCWTWARVLKARGRLHARRGQVKAALSCFQAAGEHARAWPFDNPAAFSWRAAAAVTSHELGDVEAARELVENELELARNWGSPRPLGIALRAAAAVHGGRSTLAMLEESVAVLEGSSAKLELARARTDLGVARMKAGSLEVAREQLRAGLDLAHACGATTTAERAYAELVATGARPRRPRRTGPASLTRTELKVATLAARGESNRDIAARLFVTQRAVERSLTGAYRKLGISGRFLLAGALGRHVPAAEAS